MLKLLKEHPKILFYCLAISFFGGLGQTYLIAQFIPSIEEGLGMSKSQVSGAYSLATFLSSFALSWVGHQLDKRPLKVFLFSVLTTLAIGFALLGLAREVFLLGLGFFLVRLSGQMTLGMTATTIVGKNFGFHRGKALTLVSLGRSLAEGVLPGLVIATIAYWGWRYSLGSLGVLALMTLGALTLLFVRFLPQRPLYPEVPHSNVDSGVSEEQDSQQTQTWGEEWNWKKVLQSPRVMLFMLANTYLPFALTGLFFQQGALAEMKGWSMAVLAKAFISFSACNIVANFVFGSFVDKFGARNLLSLITLPVIIGLTALMFLDAWWVSFFYLGMMGIGMGASIIIKSSFLAEVYGLRSLGKLKGMDSSVAVFATSLAPFLYGWLLDQGLAMEMVVYSLLILGILAFVIYTALSHFHRKELQNFKLYEESQSDRLTQSSF